AGDLQRHAQGRHADDFRRTDRQQGIDGHVHAHTRRGWPAVQVQVAATPAGRTGHPAAVWVVILPVTLALLAAPQTAHAFRQRPHPPEKETRTPAQRRIDAHLLMEIYRRRGLEREKQVPPGDTGVKIDAKGRAWIDVRADVSPALQRTIRRLGGVVESTSAEY